MKHEAAKRFDVHIARAAENYNAHTAQHYGRKGKISHFGCVYSGDFRGGGGGCLRGGGGLCVGLGAFLGNGGLRRGADVAGPDSGPVFGTVGFACGFACGFDVGRG